MAVWLGELTVLAASESSVTVWGANDQGQARVPAGLSGVTMMAAGGWHTVALKSDGTVVAWGGNVFGQATVPTGLTGVKAIAATRYATLALKQDGKVTAWGLSDGNLVQAIARLGPVKAIATGGDGQQVLALKPDGTVVALTSVRDLMPPPGLGDVTAIAAGVYHGVALKGDGTVVAWAHKEQDPNFDFGMDAVPSGLADVTAIAAGRYHTAALKRDGTVVAWGLNDEGQATVPPGLEGVAAIAAGDAHTVALKQDGTVVAWGNNYSSQCTVPEGLGGVSLIAAGGGHTVALAEFPGETVIHQPRVIVLRADEGAIRMLFGTELDRHYVLESSVNLSDWQPTEWTWEGNGDSVNFVRLATDQNEFFRIVATAAPSAR